MDMIGDGGVGVHGDGGVRVYRDNTGGSVDVHGDICGDVGAGEDACDTVTG